MPDEVCISFPYSADEHADALLSGSARGKLPRRMRWFGLASGSVGLLMTGLGALSGDSLATILQNGLGWLGLGAFWLRVGPALLRVATRRELAGQSTRAPGEMEHLTFNEAGFSPSPQWSQPMPWSFVERVVETERFLVIHHGYSADPFYLPKHALSPQTVEKLFAMLRQQLVRPQQLQLQSRAT